MRSLSLSIVLVAMTPGMLHPNPINIGMKDFPCSPSLYITLSTTKAALAKYPLSSSSESPKKRKNMGGRKTSTPPNPPKTASDMKAATSSLVMASLAFSPSQLKNMSIMSENGAETSNVKRKRAHQRARKIGIPTYLFRKTLSKRSDSVRGLAPFKTLGRISLMKS